MNRNTVMILGLLLVIANGIASHQFWLLWVYGIETAVNPPTDSAPGGGGGVPVVPTPSGNIPVPPMMVNPPNGITGGGVVPVVPAPGGNITVPPIFVN